MLASSNWANKLADYPLYSQGAGNDPKFLAPHDIVTNAAGATDALPSFGLVIVTKAGVDAMTLATPVAGLVSAGGDDGKKLTVISSTAQAHTITTASNKINGNKAVATFAAAIGNSITFRAYNGVWYVETSTGITLS